MYCYVRMCFSEKIKVQNFCVRHKLVPYLMMWEACNELEYMMHVQYVILTDEGGTRVF